MALSRLKWHLHVSGKLEFQGILEVERMRVIHHFLDLCLFKLMRRLLRLEGPSLFIHHNHSL